MSDTITTPRILYSPSGEPFPPGQCRFCRFWDCKNSEAITNVSNIYAPCHRYPPPRMPQAAQAFGEFPLTHQRDWCGEYSYARH